MTVAENPPAVRSNARIRIAHLQLLPILSGVQKVTLELFLRLDRDKFEPFLICQSPGPLSDEAKKNGINCLFASHLVRPISPFHDLLALWQLFRFMREYRFDVVHTHSSKTGIIGRLAGKLSGVKTVMHTVHGYAFPATNSRIMKLLFLVFEWCGARCCDALICLKQADLDFAGKWLWMPPERLFLIPNGVDTRCFRPLKGDERRDLREQIFKAGDATLVVGMVGRLWRQKNPLCFVAAAKILLARGWDAKFVLIGDGVLRVDVSAEIEQSGHTSEILILGWRNDVPRLLGGLDVFVLPSRWEGVSLSIMEAFACGVPVVASDIPGNSDVVVPGVDGFLAGCGDAEGLARQIEKLLEDESLRRNFGSAGIAKIVEKYTIEAHVRRMSSLYTELVRSGDSI